MNLYRVAVPMLSQVYLVEADSVTHAEERVRAQVRSDAGPVRATPYVAGAAGTFRPVLLEGDLLHPEEEYCELHELEPGARFRFYGMPEAGEYVLVEKTLGRAHIRRVGGGAVRTRTFKARQKNGEHTQVTIAAPVTDEPCALGAHVIPVAPEEVTNG